MERRKMTMSWCLKLTGEIGMLVEIRSGAVDCGLNCGGVCLGERAELGVDSSAQKSRNGEASGR
jgi:hypothetical protein